MYECLCFVVIVISMYECFCFVVIVISMYERLIHKNNNNKTKIMI
jgi:hypothetical protein